ncbi:hypothetical protein GTA28_28860 [Rhodococcus hoagii]|nr:hypothetical protein [Prescottella equi]
MAAPAAAAQPAANTAPAPGGAAPAPTRQTLPDTGRHHRPDDGLAASGSQHLPSHSSSDTAAASMAAAAFLTLLRGPIAGAHTRLALLRTQQFTTNTVTASAIGTFETATGTTYVLATAHGVSYLSHDGAVPTDTRSSPNSSTTPSTASGAATLTRSPSSPPSRRPTTPSAS